MRYTGLVKEANEVFPNVFKAIRGRTAGAPFFSYYKMDPCTGLGELDLCVPTEEIPSSRGIEVKEMPRFKAICITHIGSYETLNKAYEIIDQYALENKIDLDMPFREVFIKDPGMFFKGNPNKYITEVQFPIRED